MAVKLIDIETEGLHEITVGTCDLCESVQDAKEPVFVFSDLDNHGLTFKVDGYYFDYDFYDELEIDNFLRFAAWIKDQEGISRDDLKNFWDLEKVVDRYMKENEVEQD